MKEIESQELREANREPVSDYEKYRNYLGSSLGTTADRFTPKTIIPQYPEMSLLFPALDIGLAQNLQNSLLAPTDNTSSGAGRFLAPSTSKGK